MGGGAGMCQALGVKQGPHLVGLQGYVHKPGYAFGSSVSRRDLQKQGGPCPSAALTLIIVVCLFPKGGFVAPQGPKEGLEALSTIFPANRSLLPRAEISLRHREKNWIFFAPVSV